MTASRPGQDWAHWWVRRIVECESCTLSATARQVLWLLASHTNEAYYCDPGNDLLAIGVGTKRNCDPTSKNFGKLDHKRIKAARRELEAAGLVRVFPGGQGPKHTNGYWLAVSGAPPATRVKEGATAPLKKSTRGALQPPKVVHKGGATAPIRGALQPPEVSIEVSKERARVDSPPERDGLFEKLFDLPHSKSNGSKR